jgi:hypothetical protein
MECGMPAVSIELVLKIHRLRWKVNALIWVETVIVFSHIEVPQPGLSKQPGAPAGVRGLLPAIFFNLIKLYCTPDFPRFVAIKYIKMIMKTLFNYSTIYTLPSIAFTSFP